MSRYLGLGGSLAVHGGILGAVVLAGAWSYSSRDAETSVFAPPPAPISYELRRDRESEPKPDFEHVVTPFPSPLPVEDVEVPVDPAEPFLEEPPAPRIAPDRPAPRLDRPVRSAERAVVAGAEAEPVPQVESEEAPVELQNPPPAYPAAARRRGEEGHVVVELRVLVDGSVADPQVVESSGSPLFVKSVLSAVAGWRYRPATLGGNAVERVQRVRFVFRLDR